MWETSNLEVDIQCKHMSRECHEWAEEGSTCSVALFPVPWRSNCSILPTLHLPIFRIFYIPCPLLDFLFVCIQKFHTLFFLMLESHKQNPALYIPWWNLSLSSQSLKLHHLNVCLYHAGIRDLLIWFIWCSLFWWFSGMFPVFNILNSDYSQLWILM